MIKNMFFFLDNSSLSRDRGTSSAVYHRATLHFGGILWCCPMDVGRQILARFWVYLLLSTLHLNDCHLIRPYEALCVVCVCNRNDNAFGQHVWSFGCTIHLVIFRLRGPFTMCTMCTMCTLTIKNSVSFYVGSAISDDYLWFVGFE